MRHCMRHFIKSFAINIEDVVDFRHAYDAPVVAFNGEGKYDANFFGGDKLVGVAMR